MKIIDKKWEFIVIVERCNEDLLFYCYIFIVDGILFIKVYLFGYKFWWIIYLCIVIIIFSLRFFKLIFVYWGLFVCVSWMIKIFFFLVISYVFIKVMDYFLWIWVGFL